MCLSGDCTSEDVRGVSGWVCFARLADSVAGVVMGKLGAEVWATDLEPNLALLRDNLAANGE